MKTRRYQVPVYPVASGRTQVQQLVKVQHPTGVALVWDTVLSGKRLAVAERILAHMRTDGGKVRLVS